jgi:hypothetical protein
MAADFLKSTGIEVSSTLPKEGAELRGLLNIGTAYDIDSDSIYDRYSSVVFAGVSYEGEGNYFAGFTSFGEGRGVRIEGGKFKGLVESGKITPSKVNTEEENKAIVKKSIDEYKRRIAAMEAAISSFDWGSTVSLETASAEFNRVYKQVEEFSKNFALDAFLGYREFRRVPVDYLNTIRESPEVDEFRAYFDKLNDLRKKVEIGVKNSTKKAAKSIELTDSSSYEEIYDYYLRLQGITPTEKQINNFVSLIRGKDLAIASLIKHKDNKASRKAFEHITGLTLPSNGKDLMSLLESKWASNDSDTPQPAETPENSYAASSDLSRIPSTAVIKAMPEKKYQELYEKLEDDNYHSLNLVLEARRYGDDALVTEAENMLALKGKRDSLPFGSPEELDANDAWIEARDSVTRKISEAKKLKAVEPTPPADERSNGGKGKLTTMKEILDDLYRKIDKVESVVMADGSPVQRKRFNDSVNSLRVVTSGTTGNYNISDLEVYIDKINAVAKIFGEKISLSEYYLSASSEPAKENPHVTTLQSIVNGDMDSKPLSEVETALFAAADALEAAGLSEQYDDLIGKAAEKYAELDQKANG